MAKKKKTIIAKRKPTKAAAKRRSKTLAPKPRGRKSNVFKWAFKWLFVLGLWGGLFLIALIAWYAGELPDITSRATFDRKISITIKATDGSVITRYGEIHGDSLNIEDIPADLIYAVISIEDRRFYEHFGIDPLGLARAVVVNAQKGRFAQGGSTITQQLAKNLFLSRERTLKRKIQEAMLAIWLERELSKDEILTAYLNRVYLGSGAYGVDAAARLYFDKPVKQVSLRQCATLAGLLKAPSRYSPLRNPDLSKLRTDVVLKSMAEAGYIEQSEADSLGSFPARAPQTRKSRNNARYYTDWVVDGLDDLIGTPSEDIIIETTLHPDVQTRADQALSGTIDAHGEERAFTEGAVVVMRPDGAIIAMVGGYDYQKSQFNRVTQARRQPGSSFKPFVYLTALENGWEPDSVIIDAPFEKGEYRPKNFDEKYMDEVTLETALANSLNTVSVQLMQSTGVRPVKEMARRLGIFSPLEGNLSLALGTSSVSPLEMATAYSVIANGGLAVYPYGIVKITDKDGALYYQRPPHKATRRVIEKELTRKISAMMRGVVEYGTGRRAKLPFPAAGKTGTSQDSRDAWFVGFTDELVTGVWLGNDDNAPMDGVTGGSYPAAIWKQVMGGSRGQVKAVSNKEFSASPFDGLLGRLMSNGRRNDEHRPRYND